MTGVGQRAASRLNPQTLESLLLLLACHCMGSL